MRYRVVYVEVRSDGLEQEEGFDVVEADSPASAIAIVKKDCERAGANCHSYRVDPDDAALDRFHGKRPIGY